MLFRVQIWSDFSAAATQSGEPLQTTWVEYDDIPSSRTMAGHLLRGFCLQHDNWNPTVAVDEFVDGEWQIRGIGKAIKDGGLRRRLQRKGGPYRSSINGQPSPRPEGTVNVVTWDRSSYSHRTQGI